MLISFIVLLHRESTSSSAPAPSRQPTLITSASSPSGSSTPAPTTPILAPTYFNFAQPATQATPSLPPQLNTLVDEWLASLTNVSPASPSDELPLAHGSSRKRRNNEQDDEEGETGRKRAKKSRVVSESDASTATFDSSSEVFPSQGLYPMSSLETFPSAIPYADANSEALYGLTSALDFPQATPSSMGDLFSGNEFCEIGALGEATHDFGLGLGLVPQGIEDQPLEVGVGAYGFADLTSGAGLDFGFGDISTASAPAVDALGLEVGAGADLVSVLQQLHPSPSMQGQSEQYQFEAVPSPETVPLPVQEAEEVAALAGSNGGEQQLTLALSEEELAALAGCLEGNQLDFNENAFGLGFDAFEGPSSMCSPVTTDTSVVVPSYLPAIDMESLERDAKLSRLQSLMAEVNQLQQEVFC